MLKRVFFSSATSNQTTSSAKDSLILFKDFNLFVTYSTSDLFNLFNTSTQQQQQHVNNSFKFFSFLFSLLRISFLKCHSIYTSLSVPINKPASTTTPAAPPPQESQITLSEPIKNIDDPSSDDELQESKTNEITKTNDEDADDYLIGNLFDQENLSAQLESNQLKVDDTNTTKQANNLNNACNDTTTTTTNSTTNRQGISNLSNATQILDTTFELEQTGSQANNHVDLLIDMIDFIISLVSLCESNFELFKHAFVDSLSKQQIKEFCYMINEVETRHEGALVFPECFSSALYRLIQFLLVRNLVDTSKQDTLLDGLNLLDRSNLEISLSVNKRFLAILCQILIIRLNDENQVEKTREKIFNDWIIFLGNIEAKINKKLDDQSLNEGKSFRNNFIYKLRRLLFYQGFYIYLLSSFALNYSYSYYYGSSNFGRY